MRFGTSKSIRGFAAGTAAVLFLAACGSDEPEATPSASDESTAPEESDEPMADGDAEEPMASVEAACDLAREVDAQDGPPNADQMSRYKEVAPDEIAADVQSAADALIPVADDFVAFIATLAADDIESNVQAIDEWEIDNCGIEHDVDPVPGTTWEVDESATRVDVVATEFSFDVPTELAAGPTSFVLTSEGAQAHHLIVLSLPEGVSAQEAIESDAGEDVAATNLAAPGGEDDEAVTVDLEPGNYGFYCFLPSEDGTPHAFLGMMLDVTVA